MFICIFCLSGMFSSQKALSIACIQAPHIGMYVCLFVYMNVHSLSMSVPEISGQLTMFAIYLFHKSKYLRLFLSFFLSMESSTTTFFFQILSRQVFLNIISFNYFLCLWLVQVQIKHSTVACKYY